MNQAASSDFLQIFSFVDKVGAIFILSAIVYYGKQTIEEITRKHNQQTDEVLKKYEALQRETYLITKEALKCITKNNSISVKIEQIARKALKDEKFTKKAQGKHEDKSQQCAADVE